MFLHTRYRGVGVSSVTSYSRVLISLPHTGYPKTAHDCFIQYPSEFSTHGVILLSCEVENVVYNPRIKQAIHAERVWYTELM
jgi:hypothetical protein